MGQTLMWCELTALFLFLVAVYEYAYPRKVKRPSRFKQLMAASIPYVSFVVSVFLMITF